VIRRARGGTIEDLKLRKEGEQEKKPEYILTDVLQVSFQAIPLVGRLCALRSHLTPGAGP
jgi:hypothetical protein